MTAMSYIIIEDNGLDVPIIFPAVLHHDQVREKFDTFKLKSAGKIQLGLDGEMECFGKSTSLSIAAGENDSKIVNDWFKQSF